jgi:hypothetical protein
MKRILAVVLGLAMALVACNEADTVSHNIGQEADRFNVLRRIVFVNGITDQYLLSVEGFCSLGNDRSDSELNITCRTGENGQYKTSWDGRKMTFVAGFLLAVGWWMGRR